MIFNKLTLDPDRPIVLLSAALGAVTGLRGMAAPTLLAREFSPDGGVTPDGPLADALAFPGVSELLMLLASGEMIADKTSVVPDRTSPGPLLGRAVIGALAAAAYAMSARKPVAIPALVGGGSAVASAFAAFYLRRFATERMGANDAAIGMVEDAIVIAAGRAIAKRIGGR